MRRKTFGFQGNLGGRKRGTEEREESVGWGKAPVTGCPKRILTKRLLNVDSGNVPNATSPSHNLLPTSRNTFVSSCFFFFFFLFGYVKNSITSVHYENTRKKLSMARDDCEDASSLAI